MPKLQYYIYSPEGATNGTENGEAKNDDDEDDSDYEEEEEAEMTDEEDSVSFGELLQFSSGYLLFL